MSFKRFRHKDIVNNTIVAKPEFDFVVHSGSTYLNRERSVDGDYSNKIKHIPSGHISLHELNINRPSGSLITAFVEKNSSRYSLKAVSTREFDDAEIYAFGDTVTQTYPLSASLSRIYVPAGQEFSSSVSDAHTNKKYIRALKNVVESSNKVGRRINYGNLGTSAVNMVCIPGIFYGSEVEKKTLELNYYITGTLVATAKDLNGDGRLVETYGPSSGQEVGLALYTQGLLLLTSSTNLEPNHQDYFFSTSSLSNPSWLSFGTGTGQAGQALEHTSVISSSYSVFFRGVNKIPSITMFAFSEKGEHNFSHNPTFVSRSAGTFHQSGSQYIEARKDLKKINKSDYVSYEEDFEGVTYISKVGIYDKDKNLIAIASLANPIKKTEKRDFMIKMKLDF